VILPGQSNCAEAIEVMYCRRGPARIAGAVADQQLERSSGDSAGVIDLASGQRESCKQVSARLDPTRRRQRDESTNLALPQISRPLADLRDTALAMSDPVRWGILSTAAVNRNVIPGAKASPRAELVAVASRDQARAAAHAREWEIEHAYGSYEALLDDSDVEAVYISLPNSLHCEWSIRALEAGKHVLCEKPLSRHPDDVAAAFDIAERASRYLSEAFMYRHNPQTTRLQQLVAAGAIGELRLIRAAFSFPLDDPDSIVLRPELEGGALMDVGCYCVSASRLLAGEPETAHAEAWFGPGGVDSVTAGTLHFGGGVIGIFDCGTALAARDELEVIGSEGSLFVDDPWLCVTPGIELRRDGRTEWVDVERVDSYRLELENLSAAIRDEADLLLGRDDAVGQARVLEALHRAATTGEAVSLR
jgi:D-xylose 1-dehydrogenase (NADP+, D-xylono-1,5-lactone-forming)